MPTTDPLEDTPITSGLKKHQILREYHEFMSQETPRTVLGNLILHRNAPDAPKSPPSAPKTPKSQRRLSRSSIPARLIPSSPAQRRTSRRKSGPLTDMPSSPLLASFSESSLENVRPVRTKRKTLRKPAMYSPQTARTSQNPMEASSEASLKELEAESGSKEASLPDFERTAADQVVRRLRGSRRKKKETPDFRGAVRSQTMAMSLEMTEDEATTSVLKGSQPIRGRRRMAVVEEKRFDGVVASQETPMESDDAVPNENEDDYELPSAIVGQDGAGMLAASTPNVLTSTRMMVQADLSEVASSSELNSLRVEEGTSQVRQIRHRALDLAAKADQFADIVAAPSSLPVEDDPEYRPASPSLQDGPDESIRDASQSFARRMTRSARKSAITPRSLMAQSGFDTSEKLVEASVESLMTENKETQRDQVAPEVHDYNDPEIRNAVKVMLGEKLADRTFVSQVMTNLDPKESVDEVFKKPVTPPQKRTTARKRAYQPDPQQLFNRQDVKFQFQRFSKQKVTSKCMPRLMEISERFSQKVIKSLNQRIENDPHQRKNICLADMKSIMEEFGFIPAEDPRSSHLFSLLQEILPKAEADVVVPYALWNGKPNQGTLPEDAWDSLPNRGQKRQRRKR